MKTGPQKFKLNHVVPAMLMAAIAVASSQAHGDDDLLNRIEKQMEVAKKTVENDLLQEKDLQAVKIDLQKLLKAVDEELSAIGGEENPKHPVLKVHSNLLRMLNAVDARLPQDDLSPGTSRISLLPVPHYDEKKIVGQAAREVVEAQQKLAEHVRNTKSSSKETSKLLANVVQAQEKLAWEVGWPFTAEEAAIVKKAGGLTDEAYLNRRNRGVSRINAQLKKSMASTGREATVGEFTIFSPESDADLKEVERRLVEQRGESVKKVWRKGTTPFDAKAFRQLATPK